MIRVDEDDPIGEVELSFPYRDVQIKRNSDPTTIYTLETELGRGKFGTVYKCREKASGLKLAAKFVSVPKKEDRRNVEREIDIMKELQHPRLLQLYDAFENGKMMYLILELIEGGELFERVIDDDFVLTEKSCAVFMRQICDGIDFIHKQKILHLDMKPENILCLSKTGNRVKIIDFGLARRFDPDKKLQVLFGTPEFVAPEVVNFDQIGFGTDMWSVGVICYVLLSGLSPFMGHTDLETMANVTIAKYDFDDEAFQDISENAKDFIKKLLIKNMNNRMSAEDCLNHCWLKKPPKKPERETEMEVCKDNLKLFVERWTEHPDSPYIFEITKNAMNFSLNGDLSSSVPSLNGMSPSPCGSLSSSVTSNEAFLPSDYHNPNVLQLPLLDSTRRASDSTCIIKKADACERVNLAEEIKKLSDKLFQLSNLSTDLKSNDFDQSKGSVGSDCRCSKIDSAGYECRDHTLNIIPKSSPITIESRGEHQENGQMRWEDGQRHFEGGQRHFEGGQKHFEGGQRHFENEQRHFENGQRHWENRHIHRETLRESAHTHRETLQHSRHEVFSAPSGRTKHRISNTSRDVPNMPKYISQNFNGHVYERFERTVSQRADAASNNVTSASSTKDLLLKLLNRWEGPQDTNRSSTRHGSISSEYTENNALGQKSMSSINNFFQSRAHKKITSFQNVQNS